MKNIYIDMDGVLNAISTKPPKQNTQWYGDWNTATVKGYPILWSTELIAELNTLSERGDVQFIVLSTWREEALTVLAPVLGLNTHGWDFIHVPDTSMFVYSAWWKLEEIQTHLEESKPEKAVWIDDDILYYQPAMDWGYSVSNLKIVCPHTPHGLSKPHLSGIIKFLA